MGVAARGLVGDLPLAWLHASSVLTLEVSKGIGALVRSSC